MGKRGRPLIFFPPDVLAMFGKVPDRVIAAKMGIHPMTVASRRRKAGIAPHEPDRSMVEAPNRKNDPLLGLVHDSALAAHRGVSRQAITARRAARGIQRSVSAVVLAEMLIEVHQSAKVMGDGTVSLPADLYERIGDIISR